MSKHSTQKSDRHLIDEITVPCEEKLVIKNYIPFKNMIAYAFYFLAVVLGLAEKRVQITVTFDEDTTARVDRFLSQSGPSVRKSDSCFTFEIPEDSYDRKKSCSLVRFSLFDDNGRKVVRVTPLPL